MINFIVSLLLGMLPEVLYFTLFLSFTKKIKTKRLKLFLLLAIGYILLIMICRYQLIFYLVYIVYSYLVLKLLYKSEIIDFFICSMGLSYITIVGLIGYLLIGYNYVVYYIIARIVLYFIFLFKNKLNVFYNFYKSCWNRKDNLKIKSITLRNISLVFLNLLIIIFNICAILCAIASIK